MSNKLVIHVETTGLPDRAGLLRGQYPDFRHVTKYNSSRLVRLSWLMLDQDLHELERHSYIIKPTDFLIPSRSVQYHGITHNHALEVGVPFVEIVSKLAQGLETCSAIVGHNLDFSRHVLLSELSRCDAFRVLLEKVIMLEECCTMKLARDELGRLKYPSLEELSNQFLPDVKDTKLGLCAKIYVFFERHHLSDINGS